MLGNLPRFISPHHQSVEKCVITFHELIFNFEMNKQSLRFGGGSVRISEHEFVINSSEFYQLNTYVRFGYIFSIDAWQINISTIRNINDFAWVEICFVLFKLIHARASNTYIANHTTLYPCQNDENKKQKFYWNKNGKWRNTFTLTSIGENKFTFAFASGIISRIHTQTFTINWYDMRKRCFLAQNLITSPLTLSWFVVGFRWRNVYVVLFFRAVLAKSDSRNSVD